MSAHEVPEPGCTEATGDAIEIVIEARRRSLGDFSVGRVLPAVARRSVGPFVFFDQMGPADLAPGQGVNVRPHPHVNLATVTYLFEGQIEHRDSLGVYQVIEPGAINWMTAGRGIVHSERSSEQERSRRCRVSGIQLWVALPKEHEEIEPSFAHHPAASLPCVQLGEVTARVLIGTAWGQTSPVETLHPTSYLHLEMPLGANVVVPEAAERAVYVVAGQVELNGETLGTQRMAVLRAGVHVVLHAQAESRVMVIGGEPLDGPRHIWWNFVSSTKERIERAKADWSAGRFPTIPGDDREFIPLPR